MAQSISANQRLGGLSFITINGVTLLLGDDFDWSPSTPDRETKKGLTGVYGYKETPSPGHMKGTAYDYGTFSVTDLGNIVAEDVIASLANGKVVTLSQGWNVERPVVNAAEGSFSFNFESGRVTELAAA